MGLFKKVTGHDLNHVKHLIMLTDLLEREKIVKQGMLCLVYFENAGIGFEERLNQASWRDHTLCALLLHAALDVISSQTEHI